MKNQPPPRKRKSTFWIIINALLVGAAAVILYIREHPAPETAGLTPPPMETPEPLAVPAATPFPAPPPLPSATPTPEPPIALSRVDRRALPKQVMLLKPVDFVLMAQGHPIGSAHAAAGVMVGLVGVVSDGQIEVQMGDSQQAIPAADTDIESRVRKLLKYAGQ